MADDVRIFAEEAIDAAIAAAGVAPRSSTLDGDKEFHELSATAVASWLMAHRPQILDEVVGDIWSFYHRAKLGLQ
jgi:hypothetical protein